MQRNSPLQTGIVASVAYNSMSWETDIEDMEAAAEARQKARLEELRLRKEYYPDVEIPSPRFTEIRHPILFIFFAALIVVLAIITTIKLLL